MSDSSHTYDENSRLESAGGTTYTYDWVGNRVTPGSMVYDYADELTSWPGQHQYTYLDTGSLYQQKTSGGTVQKTFAYTPANLLSSVVHAGIGTTSMEWDADSNRVSFTSSTGGTWEYMYDITAGIPAVIKETGSKTYVREPDGSLVAMFVGSYPYYYHFDALGSTRMLTDESGHITDSYTYDAWGNATHDSGTTAQPYQYVGQLGYYSHYQDSNLPLLQLGVRFYDSGIGRFGQRDRLRHAINRYPYVADRPTTAVDPSGLSAWEKMCHVKYRACLVAKHTASTGQYGGCLLNCYLSSGMPWMGMHHPEAAPGQPWGTSDDPWEWQNYGSSNGACADENKKVADWVKCPEIQDELKKCIERCKGDHRERMTDAHNDCLDAYCKCTSRRMPF